MKKMDIFCASQASTAVCSSTDQAPSSSATIQLGGKSIDRHNPIIRGFTRTGFPSNPCVFQPPPIDPKPCNYHQLQKIKKSSSVKESKNSSVKRVDLVPARKSFFEAKEKNDVIRRKSSFEVRETAVLARKSWADLITPPGSSRYLLSDAALEYDHTESKENQAVNQDESIDSKLSLSSKEEKKPSKEHVVVLRVSLHCKGCEGKVRKHISRMEGVTSFTIDFAAKKVTIIGNVTSLGVLASVSKVKSAQLWRPESSNVEAKK